MVDFNALFNDDAPTPPPIPKEQRQSVRKAVTGTDNGTYQQAAEPDDRTEDRADQRPKRKRKPKAVTGDTYDIFAPAWNLAGEQIHRANSGWTVTDWIPITAAWAATVEQFGPGSPERAFVNDLEIAVLDYLNAKQPVKEYTLADVLGKISQLEPDDDRMND